VVDLPVASWVAAGLAFFSVALGTISLSLIWEWWRERVIRRRALVQLREIADQGLAGALGVGETLFRRIERTSSPAVGFLLARIPQLQAIELLLEQAGMTWSIQSFLLLTTGFGFATALATFILTGWFVIAIVGSAIGAIAPYMLVVYRRKRRLAAFEERLPDTIDLLTRAIRAGHPLTAGIHMVAEESPEPVASEFRRAFEEQRFGLPLDDSLLGMADRVALVDVRILTTAIIIQRNVGGNLAEILENLAYTIRERFKIRRQLRVYTAQGRLSGYILAVLPIAMGLTIYTLNPPYIMTLFTDPMGKAAIGVAAVLQVIGFFWIRRIVDIEI
jgi:tight adherence protein B